MLTKPQQYLGSTYWDGVYRINSFFDDFCSTRISPIPGLYDKQEFFLKTAALKAFNPHVHDSVTLVTSSLYSHNLVTAIDTLFGYQNVAKIDYTSIKFPETTWIIKLAWCVIINCADHEYLHGLGDFIKKTSDILKVHENDLILPRHCVYVVIVDEYILDDFKDNDKFLVMIPKAVDSEGIAHYRDRIWGEAFIRSVVNK